ncbi:MAG TPA: hypothetical protein VER35_01890 [Candidatus Limnocylindrales bacterium]|nr:hypothetical protein [Candidatus Limnocylindrales bacterium]
MNKKLVSGLIMGLLLVSMIITPIASAAYSPDYVAGQITKALMQSKGYICKWDKPWWYPFSASSWYMSTCARAAQ